MKVLENTVIYKAFFYSFEAKEYQQSACRENFWRMFLQELRSLQLNFVCVGDRNVPLVKAVSSDRVETDYHNFFNIERKLLLPPLIYHVPKAQFQSYSIFSFSVSSMPACDLLQLPCEY